MNHEYLVAEELRSKTQVWRKFNLSDGIFIFIFLLACAMLRKYVSSSIQVFYWIWNAVFVIFCCLPSKINSDKKMWQSIVLMLICDKSVYHSIEGEKKDNVKIEYQ